MTSICNPQIVLKKQNKNLGGAILVLAPFLPFLSGDGVVRLLGILALVFVLFFLFAQAFFQKSSEELKWPSRGIISLIVTGIFLGGDIEFQYVIQIIQLITISLVILFLPSIGFSELSRKAAVFIAATISAIILIDLYSGSYIFFSNPNNYGIVGMAWFFLIISFFRNRRTSFDRASLFLVLAPVVLLIGGSNSRASMLALMSALVWIHLIRPNFKRKARLVLFIFIIASPIIIAALLIIGGDNGESGWVYDYTGKTIFSGRDIIWSSIISDLSSVYYKGFGIGALPGGSLSEDYGGLSAHNGYLQIAYQFGVFGLILLIFSVFFIFFKIDLRDDRGLSSGVLLGAMVNDMFEVALFQNHFGFGLMIWIVVSMRKRISIDCRVK